MPDNPATDINENYDDLPPLLCGECDKLYTKGGYLYRDINNQPIVFNIYTRCICEIELLESGEDDEYCER